MNLAALFAGVALGGLGAIAVVVLYLRHDRAAYRRRAEAAERRLARLSRAQGVRVDAVNALTETIQRQRGQAEPIHLAEREELEQRW